MKKNTKWNIMVVVVVITSVVAWMVWSISLYTYSIFFRVLDLKSQIYLTLEGDSIKNKQIIDYLTDPINNQYWNYENRDNFKLNSFSKMVDFVEDKVIPGKESYYFLTDFDIESTKNLNKVKRMVIYYWKTGESWSLQLSFVRYNKFFSSNFQTWKIDMEITWCTSNSNTNLSEYSCEYSLRDFSNDLKNNEYNYLLFFKSESWISYLLNWKDSSNNDVKLPSRFLNQEFNLSSKSTNVTKTIKSKVDLYEKYHLNLNKSLYWIR